MEIAGVRCQDYLTLRYRIGRRLQPKSSAWLYILCRSTTSFSTLRSTNFAVKSPPKNRGRSIIEFSTFNNTKSTRVWRWCGALGRYGKLERVRLYSTKKKRQKNSKKKERKEMREAAARYKKQIAIEAKQAREIAKVAREKK
ncbi:hypothetical protein ACJQWK_00220 [Exserohilum turcicum]